MLSAMHPPPDADWYHTHSQGPQVPFPLYVPTFPGRPGGHVPPPLFRGWDPMPSHGHPGDMGFARGGVPHMPVDPWARDPRASPAPHDQGLQGVFPPAGWNGVRGPMHPYEADNMMPNEPETHSRSFPSHSANSAFFPLEHDFSSPPGTPLNGDQMSKRRRRKANFSPSQTPALADTTFGTQRRTNAQLVDLTQEGMESERDFRHPDRRSVQGVSTSHVFPSASHGSSRREFNERNERVSRKKKVPLPIPSPRKKSKKKSKATKIKEQLLRDQALAERERLAADQLVKDRQDAEQRMKERQEAEQRMKERQSRQMPEQLVHDQRLNPQTDQNFFPDFSATKGMAINPRFSGYSMPRSASSGSLGAFESSALPKSTKFPPPPPPSLLSRQHSQTSSTSFHPYARPSYAQKRPPYRSEAQPTRPSSPPCPFPQPPKPIVYEGCPPVHSVSADGKKQRIIMSDCWVTPEELRARKATYRYVPSKSITS